MSRSRLAASCLVIAVALLGCGPDRLASSGADDESSSAPTGDDPTAGSTTNPTTTVDPTTDPEESDDDGMTSSAFFGGLGDCAGHFYCSVNTCDPFAQDCPEGEKCMPLNQFGNHWDYSRCVPIVGDGAPGEPCTIDDPAQGPDDCGPTSMCFDGSCEPFCTGDADNPVCAEGLGCRVDPEENPDLAICLPSCNPLMPACEADDGCYWGADQFLCNPAGSTATGEPCGFVNDCSPGHACLVNEAVPSCLGASCCAPFCDLTQPDCSALPGTECEPWYENAGAPPGLEDVGVCRLP